MELGNRVKARREELGLSQEELARKLGYKSRSSINKIELGVNDVSQSKIKYLADALQTTPAYLMGWSDEPQVENESEKDELAEYLEELRTRPEMKMLFSLAKGATKEDVEKAVKIIETLLGKE
ncbi:MAG: helix-turn-helix domain-containing protein [Acutalibacteraceae bacterium]|jgi:transcriptional regulator with XRE-family HTH domain